MSSPRFALKRVGYLAACQGLDQPDRSPVVLLTTNLLQKELRGANVNANGGENIYHAGLAINCLSNIATEDLGQALLPELLHMLSHPSPYIRKKALLCLYKVFLKYPQGLRLSYDKIKLCLDDPHPSVVSCAVNVITELAEKNPKNYLPLAPSFFKLLTSSANNWMLIKVVKLLGSLVPEEPRLARKLLEPLSGMVKSTHAKSLLYEAVFAITLCLPYVKKADGTQPANIPEVVELCVETLRSFVSDSDQNLKYLGLVGFGSLLLSQPRVLHSHPECRGLILQCLSDEDVTIRTRALGLLKFMATKRNLADLISQLLSHVEAASGEYRCQLVEEIIRMCSSNKYELVMDFSWYVDVLVILAGVRGIENQGDMIAKQWMDVAWRVLPVRCYAVRRSLEILICRGPGVDDDGVAVGSSSRRGDAKDSDRHFLPEVLPAAAWIVGEYSQLIPDGVDEEGLNTIFDASSKGPYHALIQALTAPTDAAGMNPLPCPTQAVFVQNAMKVFSAACQRNVETQNSHGINLGKLVCSDEELHACAETLLKNLVIYAESTDPEVKERAFTSYQLLLSIGLPSSISFTTVASAASTCRDAAATLTYLLTPEPMKPISSKAQKRLAAEGPPSPVSVRDWEKGVDWDVFWFAEEETPWFDKDGNVKGSVENISFTKQLSNSTSREVRGADAVGTEPIPAIQQPFGVITSAVAEKVPFGNVGSTTSGAQPPSISHQRVGDPFYLNSRPSPTINALFTSKGTGMGGGTVDATNTATTRFGVLTLDSGGESEEESGRKQKKKKKKTKNIPKQRMGVAIADSDEEEDDHLPQTKRGSAGKGDRAKEFANLALVDLTTPLGEDDVMPRNEHYVVPERPPVRPDAAHQKQKKKKKDKDKKKSSRKEKAPSAAVTGDLLGFDAMGFGAPVVDKPTPLPTVAAPTIVSSSSNPVNTAFDDLLGLEMPPYVEASSVIKSSEADEAKARKAAKKASKKAKKKSKL